MDEWASYHEYVQWLFADQWTGLKAHANGLGIQIIGDIPIFVAEDSADVWARPDQFKLDGEGNPTVIAGVPPDNFAKTGQRWGNPHYRWDAMAQDGYRWWIERIQRTLAVVDIVRIDHFRGFAACWRIPASEPTAIHGEWVAGPGAALFDAVSQALGPLPIIAEDLGIITPDVVSLRRRFDFPGMRVLQFAWGGDSGNTFLPHNHEADAVVYAGTHDNDTSVGWWAGASQAERHHLREYLPGAGHEIHWDLIRAACASVADTAVHPMQDVLGLDSAHRMNFPGLAEGCWEWRFSWEQVAPWHAQRLASLCRLYRRDGMPLQG